MDLFDERRPLCLSRGQFRGGFDCGAAVRARSDDAGEHRRDGNPYNRWIKLDRSDQYGDENKAAAHHGDLAGEDEFAAVFDPSGELIDLRLELHDLVAMVAVVHG